MSVQIIQKYDWELSNMLELSNNELNYYNSVMPIAEKLLQELLSAKFFPREYKTENPWNIYIESIFLHVIYNYMDNKVNNDLPMHCYVLLLKHHPYAYSMLQCNRSKQEWRKFLDDILKSIQELYGEDAAHMKELIDVCKNETIKDCSALQHFYYFIRAQFIQELVAITYDTLPKIPSQQFQDHEKCSHIFDDDVSFLVVNISYNLHNDDAIVTYRNVEKNKNKLLDINTIHIFSQYDIPKAIKKYDTMYSILDKNFNPITKFTDKVYVLMCYCDTDSYKTSKFSVALYGDSGYISRERAQNMIVGNIPKIYRKTDVAVYLEENFMNKIQSPRRDRSELRSKYESFMNIIREVYNESTHETFADNLIQRKDLLNIIPSIEIPYFRTYLDGLKSLLIQSLASYSEYCTSYIYPNLSINTDII